MTKTMTAIDKRDLRNHVTMFSGAALVRKKGRGWWVSFRDFGPPCPFKTKSEAVDFANNWPNAIALSDRVAI